MARRAPARTGSAGTSPPAAETSGFCVSFGATVLSSPPGCAGVRAQKRDPRLIDTGCPGLSEPFLCLIPGKIQFGLRVLSSGRSWSKR